MMAMPQGGEGYSTLQGGYPHLPSSRIDESTSKDVESETSDSDATVQLNKNDYEAPKVHDPLEEDDMSDEEGESDVSEEESEANNCDDDIHSEIGVETSDDDIHSEIAGDSSDDDGDSLQDDGSRNRRPSAISWMHKRGSSTSLLNRQKQSSTKVRGTSNVYNYWMAKKPKKRSIPGVRLVESGKWEVRIASYQKTRCRIGTFETLDQAEVANKVARTVLMATRDLQLSPEEIKENMVAARVAAKEAVTAGISPESINKKRKHEDQPVDDPALPEGFDMWLASRKKQWAQDRQKKWEEQVCTTMTTSLSTDTFSDWLTSRKKSWSDMLQRKRRKFYHQLAPDKKMSFSSSKKTSKHYSSATGKQYLPTEAVAILKAWISSPEHINNPYPTSQEVDDLLQQTGIDKKQLKNWFANTRARMRKEQSQQTDEKSTFSKKSTPKKKRKKSKTTINYRTEEAAEKWKESIFNEESLSFDTFSDWLFSRKKSWEAIRQRKRRKIQTQQIDLNNEMLLSPRKTSKYHLPKEAVIILKDWMSEHIDYPYPAKEDKQELAKKTGIIEKQVQTWFVNSRGRMKKKQSKQIEAVEESLSY